MPLARLLIAALMAAAVAPLPASSADPEPPPEKPAPTVSLTVRFTGLKSDKGSVAVALYGAKAAWLKRPERGASLAIRDRACVWEVPDLPPGEYAVSAFHDRNGNGRLDTGLFRIPKEPYGFSNNARGLFGPPGWDEARFSLGGESGTIRVRLK